MNKTRCNDSTVHAFIAKKVEIDTMLDRRKRLSDEHFITSLDEITWGDTSFVAGHCGKPSG